ncbi:MAG: hypothetical protein H0X51_10135 [Parachlamydiaceae bacterium]|nr:hypothetical protein [Tatlockia sp.]MBA3958734.1 hypothetical protein [Parachlamydiaceae bacterium]
MRKLKKYKLNFDKAFYYFAQHVCCGNALSTSLLAQNEFREGDFYTILPDNAVLERLDLMDAGWIIPQENPKEPYVAACTMVEFRSCRFCGWGKSLSVRL